MKHGEIYWVDLPDRGGREQRGRRPAIVWQDTESFELPTILIIPLTSRIEASRFPGTISIKPSKGNGLSAESLALVFQLSACDVRRFQQRLGKLGLNDIERLRDLALQLQKMV